MRNERGTDAEQTQKMNFCEAKIHYFLTFLLSNLFN